MIINHTTDNLYKDFIERLKLFIAKHPNLIVTALSNIFTMRLIGNKTHGDLAEIAVAEFINQYMYDFSSVHVGKYLFRAKSQEEDIKVTNEILQKEFFISLKAYGNGPLQLSTDKSHTLFPRLQKEGSVIDSKKIIKNIFTDSSFLNSLKINALPLIYDEKRQCCNIMVFNHAKAHEETVKIILETKSNSKSKNRIHSVYKFYGKNDSYIYEVRYGGKSANALQRGLWTHTIKGANYFDSVTGKWINYSHNKILVELFSHALVASDIGHKEALEKIKKNILVLKESSGIRLCTP